MSNEDKAKAQVEKIGLPEAGSEPSFLGDPVQDQLLEIVLALSSELWVERDRRIHLESLLQSKDLISKDELDNLNLDDTARTQRDAALEQYVQRTLGPLKAIKG